MHIDFMQLIAGKPTTIEVPVSLSGNARGVRNGGKLKHTLRKLSVRALPKDLPDGIDINITDLRIGQSIRVEDVSTTNFEIINPSSAVICSIKMARGAVDESDESDDEGEEGAEAAAEESAEA